MYIELFNKINQSTLLFCPIMALLLGIKFSGVIFLHSVRIDQKFSFA